MNWSYFLTSYTGNWVTKRWYFYSWKNEMLKCLKENLPSTTRETSIMIWMLRHNRSTSNMFCLNSTIRLSSVWLVLNWNDHCLIGDDQCKAISTPCLCMISSCQRLHGGLVHITPQHVLRWIGLSDVPTLDHNRTTAIQQRHRNRHQSSSCSSSIISIIYQNNQHQSYSLSSSWPNHHITITVNFLHLFHDIFPRQNGETLALSRQSIKDMQGSISQTWSGISSCRSK